MQKIHLDCSALPSSIPLRSELPNSIYIDASDLQRVLSDFLRELPNTISEGLKAGNEANVNKSKDNELLSHLGKVELIWDDGFQVKRPIGSLIRGITKCGERYSSYKLYYNDKYSFDNLTRKEKVMLHEWLTHLETGKAEASIMKGNKNG